MNNTILIKNALILNSNNFENKKQSLLIKDDLIAEIAENLQIPVLSLTKTASKVKHRMRQIIDALQ
jgi:dihydroorotase-like cyclic amidohydrolase